MPAMRAFSGFFLAALGLVDLGCGRNLGVPPSLPPTLVLVSPATENTEQDPVQGPFTIEVAPGSGGAVAKVEWWTPGHARVERPGPPFSWTLDTAALIDGRGVLSIYAIPIGPEGRRGATSIFTFFVNNTPPHLAVLRPADGHVFTVGGDFEVAVCVHTAPGQGLGGPPQAQLGTAAPIALALAAAPAECLDGNPDGGAGVQRFTGSLPVPLDDASLDGFDLTVSTQDRAGNTDSRSLHLRATREIWARTLTALPREVHAIPGGVGVVSGDGTLTFHGSDGSAGGRVNQPAFLAAGFVESSGLAAIASATGVSGHERAGYLPSWVPGPSPAWGPSPLDKPLSLGASGLDAACFGNADAFVQGLPDVQCSRSDGSVYINFGYGGSGSAGAVWLGMAGTRIIAPRFLDLGAGPKLYLYTWNAATGQKDPVVASLPGGAAPDRPLLAHADRYGAVVTWEGASFFIDPDTGAASDACPTNCNRSIAAVAAGPAKQILWYQRQALLNVSRVEVSNGATIAWQRDESLLADIPAGGPWSQLGAFDARGYAFLALSARRESYSEALVVAYDDAGNRRWHWNGAAHVVGISLMPDDPAAPVYLIDGDWMVRALVR